MKKTIKKLFILGTMIFALGSLSLASGVKEGMKTTSSAPGRPPITIDNRRNPAPPAVAKKDAPPPRRHAKHKPAPPRPVPPPPPEPPRPKPEPRVHVGMSIGFPLGRHGHGAGIHIGL